MFKNKLILKTVFICFNTYNLYIRVKILKVIYIKNSLFLLIKSNNIRFINPKVKLDGKTQPFNEYLFYIVFLAAFNNFFN